MTNLEKAEKFFEIVNSHQTVAVTDGVLYVDGAAVSTEIVDALAGGYDQLMA